MADRYYLTDGAHVLMSGSTGSGDRFGGKTSTLNWWQDMLYRKDWVELSVYITPKRGEEIAGATKVRTIRELAEAYREGERQIHVETQATRLATDALEDEHEEIVETVRRLPGEKAVVHDEAQAYGGSQGLAWCLSEGGNLKQGDSIRSLCGTQRAWNLHHELLNLLTIKCWVGPLTSEGERYFRTAGMRHVADQIKGEMEPYHWAVTDGGELINIEDPVPAEYA